MKINGTEDRKKKELNILMHQIVQLVNLYYLANLVLKTQCLLKTCLAGLL